MTEQTTPTPPKEKILSLQYVDFINAKYNLGLTIVPKSQSRLMKIVGPILRVFNKEFDDYNTTIGSTMYIPDANLKPEADQVSITEIYMHESVHAFDDKRLGGNGLVFKVAYLFPQVLGLLALLALGAVFASKLWLLWLICLVFFAPIPAYFRMLLEVRGYKTSTMLGNYLYNIKTLEQQQFIRDNVVKQLTTGQYYWCWPFASQVDKNMQDQTYLTQEPYTAMKEFIDAKMLPPKSE